jgi:hypothetical protein
MLWLVSTARQAWLMLEKQPGAIVLTLGEAAEFAAHLVYGAVTEMLRRLLRGRRADRSRG